MLFCKLLKLLVDLLILIMFICPCVDSKCLWECIYYKNIYKNNKKENNDMKKDLFGVVKLNMDGLKKSFRGAAFAITLGAAIPATSQAIDLDNPNACSSGITNMMSDMGLMAYSVANFMNGFCKSMPFFGMFCPDLDKMAGSFFSKILENPDLTLEMMACANANDGMLSFMIDVMDKNPGLLRQVGYYMEQTGDGTSQGCELGEALTQMALNHSNMKNFLFAKIDDDLYGSLSAGMQCKNETTVNVTKLLDQNAEQVLQGSTPFTRAFANMGTVDDSDDGNEIATEDVFSAVFANVTAAGNFMSALSQVDGETQKSMMDLMFLGKIQIPEKTCAWWDWQCTPRDASEQLHAAQAHYNMYASIKGFTIGVLPAYDQTLPPAPDSSAPANALFGQFMGLIIGADGQMNEYGFSFFKSMVSGAQIHQWAPAGGMLTAMIQLVEGGFTPFTLDQLMAMMPQLMDQNSPVPRELGSGDNAGSTDDGTGGGTDGGTTSPTNTAPSVAIDSPSSGATSTAGEMNSFTATASDNEDGAISGNVKWSSNIDGSMGQGATINASLTAGSHTITASITDSDGAKSTATVKVTINPVIGENIAPNASVSASSTYMSYYSASKINDGDESFNNYWMSDYISYWNPADEKVYLTWGGTQEVNEVTIHWQSSMLPSSFTVYALVNGSWANMTGSMSVTRGSDTVYLNVNTSKIYIKMGAPNYASQVGIHEIEVRK
ncbi:MAG: hypothetical protein DIZ80_15990 [endosymbiont of Galathealinum brachiosum]|uniref:F5/8 type C domain-containing protein n=1 Tax=endosymbiont of Galathealinum brachiosum TaxID=2200906 RepID=A0A370D9I9_9GAMM|nr:MAG: hypothetical protein DIZ80_15990 [endosymbiont of Galathealinum brachiosum]